MPESREPRPGARGDRLPAALHMRIVVSHYGGPGELHAIQEARPEPRKGEVRVRVLAAGVGLPDVMMREGIHPETPRLPFTPGWDLVGVVDKPGDGVTGIEPGQVVAALPIHGAYAEHVCLPQAELVPVPAGLDPAEATCLVLIHGAAGGIGTALMELGRLAGVVMYGTCSAGDAQVVAGFGATPIDYQRQDFVEEILWRTGDGVDAVFDGIGGTHIWQSRKVLRPGGKVVAYGLTASLRGGRVPSGSPRRRQRYRRFAIYGACMLGGWLLPGRKRVVPYSIQWLKRLHPAMFRQDLVTLLDLLAQKKIRPLVAQRIPLAEARRAHELLGQGNVTGKIVLTCNGAAQQ